MDIVQSVNVNSAALHWIISCITISLTYGDINIHSIETKISDLHLWKVAQNKYACIVSLVTGNPCAVEEYKRRLDGIKELVHVTIEMNTCR